MAYNLRLSELAERELTQAVNYYDLISPKLGTHFLVEVEECFAKIESNPELYSRVSLRDKTRDLKLKSFPYNIIYEIDGSKIIIISIFNTHRKPLIS
jgi:plasmid stabilization system protein ParE